MASKKASDSTQAREGAVFVRKDGNIELRVRAKPGAKRSQVMEVGTEEIGISIAAPPRDGEANDELIRHLRTVLNVSKSDLYFDKGAKSRSKILILASKGLTVEQVVEKLKSDSS
ncbi:unnamed protein product, partial [Mesorhabditis belari]|uniref:Uncharacterized protein n=1 Tax=Mesorhabditis belari TaxID=2138241 RepID=A0AAF3FE08_9BILA